MVNGNTELEPRKIKVNNIWDVDLGGIGYRQVLNWLRL